MGVVHGPGLRFTILPHPLRGLPSLASPSRARGTRRAHPPRRTMRDVQPDPACPGGPSITLASGEDLHADVIVGADGVKSRLQKATSGACRARQCTISDLYFLLLVRFWVGPGARGLKSPHFFRFGGNFPMEETSEANSPPGRCFRDPSLYHFRSLPLRSLGSQQNPIRTS